MSQIKRKQDNPITATDDEIRIRALTNETRGGWHKPSPLIRGLVRAVDEFVGDPTDDDLRRLAWDYYETVDIMKKVFEARREIKERHRSWKNNFGVRYDVWLDVEDEAIQELWNERTPNESAQDIDLRIAVSLSSMPCNVRRGVTRNAMAVKSRRCTIGIAMPREEIQRRRNAS